MIRRKLVFLTVLLVLLCSQLAQSQDTALTLVVEGTVTEVDGTPAGNLNIEVKVVEPPDKERYNLTDTTDDAGFYQITNVAFVDTYAYRKNMWMIYRLSMRLPMNLNWLMGKQLLRMCSQERLSLTIN